MDIRITAVLDLIKGHDEASNAVVAGGSVRDYVLEIPPRDYDIFVPVQDKQVVKKIFKSLEDRLGVDCQTKGDEAYDNHRAISLVRNFNFEGIDVDVIMSNITNDEDFPTELVNTFNYGMNMAYFDGSSINEDNEHFQIDRNNHYFSLLNIENISELPKSMDKYHSFNERFKKKFGYDVKFRAPCLKMLKEEKKATTTNSYSTALGDAQRGIQAVPVPEPQNNEIIWDDVWEDRPARRGQIRHIPDPFLRQAREQLDGQLQNVRIEDAVVRINNRANRLIDEAGGVPEPGWVNPPFGDAIPVQEGNRVFVGNAVAPAPNPEPRGGILNREVWNRMIHFERNRIR